MKKILSIVMSTSIIICSLFCFNSTAFADGWINYVQEVNLNQTNSTAFDSSDFSIQRFYTYYYKSFKFTVPEKGIVSVNLDSEEGNLAIGSWYYIYKQTDLENYIYCSQNQSDEQGNGYMSAYDRYYSKRNVSLSAGDYYLVFESLNDYLNTEYNFTINYKPTFPNTTISKLAPKKKAFKVNFKNCSNVSGYQVKYSTNKNMTSSKTVNVSSSASSKTVKTLKSKKTYYVKVRTYKTVNVNGANKTYYGKWSKAKAVKTK